MLIRDIVLCFVVSLVLYIIVEGVFYGGWRDADVRGARSLLKWSLWTAILPLRLLVRSFKPKRKSKPEGDGDNGGSLEKKGDNDA